MSEEELERMLYPSTMTMKFSSKQSRRKKKIKNIFNL
jgi:hypothetical protein